VAVFCQGIFHHPGEGDDLAFLGDYLLADGVIGILGVNQRRIVWGDIHPEKILRAEGFSLAGGEVQDFFKILNSI